MREADEAVALGGDAGESYLRVEKILEAARATGADAVHPGYGFLSENAAFAAACGEAGLVFVGPTPEAIAAMGSKLEAKRRIAGRGRAAAAEPRARGEARSPRALAALAEELGLPLLVKASAGGGGRGMRVVRDAAALARGGGVRRARGALRLRRRHGLPRALPRGRAPRRGADLRRRARAA